MKATIVMLAGTEGENFGRKMMLDAHRSGGMGFEMARLPQHVSLKQPFFIRSLDEIEEFFDEFAQGIKPVEIQMEQLELTPNSVIGGVPSGCLSFRVVQSPKLKALQKRLFESLERRFGPCPAEHDNDYVFHMTIAIGGAPFEKFQTAFEKLSKEKHSESFVFDRIGLLYYDDDNITPGSYFCYKIANLEK